MNNAYESCTLCARKCGVNRDRAVGFCGMPSDVYISRAALHMWEEPIISGERGSGTIFFSGCSLKCVFCQNREISRGRVGKMVAVDELADIMLGLQSDGAHNINFVTPTNYILALSLAVKVILAMPEAFLGMVTDAVPSALTFNLATLLLEEVHFSRDLVICTSLP